MRYKNIDTTPKELPDTASHGTSRAYSRYKCRCDDCRKFHADQCKTQYQKRKAQLAAGEADVVHGEVRTYSGWGCRCDRCRQAAILYGKTEPRRDKDGSPRERGRKSINPQVWVRSRPVTT